MHVSFFLAGRKAAKITFAAENVECDVQEIRELLEEEKNGKLES